MATRKQKGEEGVGSVAALHPQTHVQGRKIWGYANRGEKRQKFPAERV